MIIEVQRNSTTEIKIKNRVYFFKLFFIFYTDGHNSISYIYIIAKDNIIF